MQEHWFSLRKISGQWWNFNSLLPAPQQLSQFYLSAYLATLRDQGYSIFVVHGGLPTYPDTTVAGDQGAWLTEAQVAAPPLCPKCLGWCGDKSCLGKGLTCPCAMLLSCLLQEGDAAGTSSKAASPDRCTMQALEAGKAASDAQAQGNASAAPGGYAWAAAGKVCTYISLPAASNATVSASP